MIESESITADTTLYLLDLNGPVWYSAADTPEEAVAEAVVGIGIEEYVEPHSFTVSKMDAGDFAEHKGTMDGMRSAIHEAEELRTYDHDEAMRRAYVLEHEEAGAAVRELEDALEGLSDA
jgi:hypothetical protein